MAEQLGMVMVNRVARFVRWLAPWALGITAGLFTCLSPGVPPVTVIAYGVGPGGADMIVVGLVGVACGLSAGFARRWPWQVIAVTAVTWIAFTAYPMLVVASYYAGVTIKRRTPALIYLTVAGALVVVPTALGFDISTDDAGGGVVIGLIGAAAMVGMPYALGLWVGARRQVIAGLHERAARLEAEQAARADRARAEERARIAREMHDVVAHRVSLMVLHAGALEVSAPDERLAQEAALIRTTGREALADLRQVLGVLRAPEGDAVLRPQPDLSDLPALVAQVRAAGQPVTHTEHGEAPALPLTVQRTAYRVVQEALTNVVKHTGGANAAVTLRYLPDAVEVTVENGPSPAPVERLPGSGLGLIGLRERVALISGRIEARPRLDGGFTLTATLPAGGPA
ncbi:signal transduction histidine kinase [Allocatelliglobosispora scoriae]|uniref:histidine kinase n=1 Tax=Allocatelliglobosispora scoriae TaxID=643052 RepID=A0A841C5A9_9ACTN|nr:histidine kinase [Allocatelliglobosispora scoriae]MBB5874001.1 signal transduction histidine kinase [Allocatelliglobosispora scoriae]